MISSANGTHTEPGLMSVNGICIAAVRGQLDRVLHSRVFLHSHRIRKFLEFVVEESLTGQQQRLKEYLIGLEVFNRLEAFDPRVDSIVRVEARRLRAKLDQYYRTEGHEDEIRIELRKGSYIPHFEPRRDQPDSYPYQQVARRTSIALAPFTAESGVASSDSIDAIKRRISHVLISEGSLQVIHHDGNGELATADYILHCDIQPSGESLNLMLQLKSVPEGAYLWSTLGELGELEEITRSLNRTLVTIASQAANSRSQRRRSHNRSFESYVQARYLWKKGNPDAIQGSIDYFASAVETDPLYASAWAGLAGSLIVSTLFGLCDSKEVRPRIEEATRTAQELNEGLPEVYLALGAFRSLFECKWQAGEQEFLRAIQLDGRDSSVHAAYALQLACRGMTNAALVQIERALELSPACLNSNFILGWLLGLSGKFDQAIAQHKLIIQFAPDFALARLGLGWDYANQGLWPEALDHFEEAARLLNNPALLAGCLGSAHAKVGNREQAFVQLDRLKEHFESDVSVAAIHACLGEADLAFEYLDKAVNTEGCCLPLRLLNPEFKSLRSEARFPLLLARIGLKRLAEPKLYATQ